MGKDGMNLKLTKRLVWRLPVLMAEHRIRTATELKRRLEELGYEITSVHVARLVHDRPQRISSDLLDALVTIFDCTANEILAVEMVNPDEEGRETMDPKASESVPRTGKADRKREGKPKPKATRANLPEGMNLENITGPKLHAIPNPYSKKDK